MDKNFLGLGITFTAVDNGMTDVAGKVSGAVKKTTEVLDEAKKKTKAGSFFDDLKQGVKDLSLAKITHDLGNIKDKLSGKGGGFNSTAVQLDTMRAKLGAALNPKVASAFTSQLMGVMHGFGLTGEQTEVVAQNMTNAGVSLTEMQKTLPMVGSLVGVLGMDAGKVSEMFGTAMGTLHMSAGEASGLAKEIFKIQKDYQLTDLMNPLPEIIENVYKNSIRFGKVNSKQSMAAVVDITKMAAAFQKVGFSQQQAIHMATGWNDKMSDIKESILDIQVGLEPSSDSLHGLQEALASELDPSKIMGMITGGADMSDIMKEMQKEISGLGEQQQQVVMQRLKRVFGPEISAMLNPLSASMDAVDAAAAKNDKSMGTASQEYGKLEGAMKNTLGWQQKMTEAAKEFNEITLVLANKPKYIASLAAQREYWDYLTHAVDDSNSKLGMFQKIVQGLKDIGLGYFSPFLGVVGTFMGSMGDMLAPILSLLGVLTIFKKPLGMLMSVFKGLGSFGLSAVSKVFGLLGEGVGIIARLGSFGLKTFSMLGKGFMRMLGPIGWGITAFELLYEFFPPFTKAVDSFIDSFMPAIKAVGSLIYDLFTDFSGTWPKIGARLSGIGTMIVSGWKKWTGALGDIWNGMVKYLIDKTSGFTSYFTGIGPTISQAWDSVVSLMSGGLDSAWAAISDKGSGAIKGLISIFGSIKDKLSSAFGSIGDLLKDPFAAIGNAFSSAAGGIAAGMKKLFSGMFDSLPDFILAFLKGGGPMGAILSGGAALVQKGFSALFGKSDVAPAGAPMAMQAMPAQSAATMQPSTSAPSAAASAQPTNYQPSAPSSSPMPASDYKPTAVPQVKDQNFQALLQEINDMKDTMAQLLTQLINRPVNVILQGDAKKMFNVQGRQAASDAGAYGLNAAVGR